MRRLTVSFPEDLFQVLSEASAKRGFSISEIARQALDRAVDIGLFDDENPNQQRGLVVSMTQFTQYCDITDELTRLNGEQQKILHGHLKLKDQVIDQMRLRLEESTAVIIELKRGTEPPLKRNARP